MIEMKYGTLEHKWKPIEMDVRVDHTVIYYECVLTGDRKKVTHYYNDKHQLQYTEEEMLDNIKDI